MGAFIPVCLADGLAIKALAFLAVCLVAYLYWTSLREKRALRLQRRWQEEKRREFAAKANQRQEPPQ